MRKVCVPARIEVDENGGVTPLSIKAGYDGEWLDIIRIKESGRKVHLAVGGIGTRYMCIIDYEGISKELYVFNEGMKWYILAGDY
jgi:hypothetical protein